jgi:hypothetical protein
LLVKKTKDSNNLIGGEQMFDHLAFKQKANNLQNAYMATTFWSFGAKSLFGGGKFVHSIYENPNSPRADKPFFLNLYKLHYLYILMDFYLVTGFSLK